MWTISVERVSFCATGAYLVGEALNSAPDPGRRQSTYHVKASKRWKSHWLFCPRCMAARWLILGCLHQLHTTLETT